jgi:nitrate reductase NapE component
MAKKRKEKKQQSAAFRSLSKEKERMPWLIFLVVVFFLYPLT